jgi:hypothetical protein
MKVSFQEMSFEGAAILEIHRDVYDSSEIVSRCDDQAFRVDSETRQLKLFAVQLNKNTNNRFDLGQNSFRCV